MFSTHKVYFNEPEQCWKVHQWHCVYKDSNSLTTDQRRECYTNDLQNVEQTLGRLPYYSDMYTKTPSMTPAQLGRLQEVNEKTTNLKDYIEQVNEYVEFGTVTKGYDGDGNYAPLGVPFLDTIAESPGNDEMVFNRIRKERQRQLQFIRWTKETQGVTIMGTKIPTDDRNKLLIQGMFDAVLDNIIERMQNPNAPEEEFEFVSEQGSMKLTTSQARAITKPYFRYLQDCFVREAQLRLELKNAADPMTVDLESGWPNNVVS